ncbi:hypothetical protein, partial [Burkholderia pseudomallei]
FTRLRRDCRQRVSKRSQPIPEQCPKLLDHFSVQSPEQGSREIETSKPRNLETSKPQNLKTSKPQSRKAEKPKSPAPPRHQRIETESAGRAARAGGSPDKHAARSRRVLGPPRPDAVFARGASAAAHAALW